MKTQTAPANQTTRSRGFSLVELLAMILIIGTITAISVVALSGIDDEAQTNSARRNAQIIASTAESALISGAIEISVAANAQEVVDALGTGVEGTGVFEGVLYKINLNEEQRDEAMGYLEFSDGSLVFSAGE